MKLSRVGTAAWACLKTYPVGWVGGWVLGQVVGGWERIGTKAQLSPAEFGTIFIFTWDMMIKNSNYNVNF